MHVLELAGDDDTFAAAEAAAAASDVTVVAPGVALADDVDTDRATGLAFTRRVGVLVTRTDATVAGACAGLEAAGVDRTGTAAVRARDVRGTAGVDTQAVEAALGDVLVDAGLSIDLATPDHELRALFADDVCVLAWFVAETDRGYGSRAPTAKPFFQPGSMEAMLARAVVNLAGARPGTTVLDPVCGTGGILVEAGLLGAHVVGVDVQGRMVRGARENLRHYLDTSPTIVRGDARRLPVCGAVDAVVFDAPYGRQSRVEAASAGDLVAAVLEATVDLADRGVVVGDRPLTAPARAAGWTVEAVYERRVHRSLDRHVHVLTAPAR